MALSQSIDYTHGQVPDEDRAEFRGLIWPGHLPTVEVTVAGAVATGPFSYNVNSVLVQYDATVGPDTIAVIALGLKTKHVGQTESFRVSDATVAAGVITLQGRSVYDTISVTNTVATGGTLTAVDITVADEELPIGVAVALGADNTMRMLQAGDTIANMIGVAVARAASELKANTGKVSDTDVYEVNSMVDYINKGEGLMQVEMDIAIGDPVHVRHTATGVQVAGAFRNLADGGNTFQLTNAVWVEDSYTDAQGVKSAMLRINLP